MAVNVKTVSKDAGSKMKPKNMKELKTLLREYPFLIDDNCTMSMKKALSECSERADASLNSLYPSNTSLGTTAVRPKKRAGFRITPILALKMLAAFILVSSFIVIAAIPPQISYAVPNLASVEITCRLSANACLAMETIPYPTSHSLYELSEFGGLDPSVPITRSCSSVAELAGVTEKRLVTLDNPKWRLVSASIYLNTETMDDMPYSWHTMLCYENKDGHSISILQKWHGGLIKLLSHDFYEQKGSYLLDGSYLECGMYIVPHGRSPYSLDTVQRMSGVMYMPDSIAYIEYEASVNEPAEITLDEVFSSVKYIGENAAMTIYLKDPHRVVRP